MFCIATAKRTQWPCSCKWIDAAAPSHLSTIQCNAIGQRPATEHTHTHTEPLRNDQMWVQKCIYSGAWMDRLRDREMGERERERARETEKVWPKKECNRRNESKRNGRRITMMYFLTNNTDISSEKNSSRRQQQKKKKAVGYSSFIFKLKMYICSWYSWMRSYLSPAVFWSNDLFRRCRLFFMVGHCFFFLFSGTEFETLHFLMRLWFKVFFAPTKSDEKHQAKTVHCSELRTGSN